MLVLPVVKSVVISSQHLVSYPVSKGTLINVVAVVSDEQKSGTPFEGRWVSDVTREEVEEAFQDFEPTVKSLLKVSYLADPVVPP